MITLIVVRERNQKNPPWARFLRRRKSRCRLHHGRKGKMESKTSNHKHESTSDQLETQASNCMFQESWIMRTVYLKQLSNYFELF